MRKENGLVGICNVNSLAHHLNFTDAQVRIPNTVAAGSNPAVGFSYRTKLGTPLKEHRI